MASAIKYLVSYINKKRRIDTFQTPRYKDEESLQVGEIELRNSEITRVFTYEELKEATNDFGTKIGEGGYGIVYFGKLKDKREVAVKKLERNPKQREQLINEVNLISGLSHQNLITLYGFTNTDDHLFLVYEYVPNDTVLEHLHAKREVPLAWNVRVGIAMETAEALFYLHSHNPRIVHRDVKPANILLNNDFSVKVADFGLCRLLPENQLATTVTQNTLGYQDPQYKSKKVITLTDKSDVYSFGVLLMELISRRPAVDIHWTPGEVVYLDIIAVKLIINNQLRQLIDPGLEYVSDSEVRMMVDRTAHLAIECLKKKGEHRPPMAKVLSALNSIRSQVPEGPGVYNGPKEVYRQIWTKKKPVN